ncbi:anthrone oxygenase family protein [Taibaiella koreensis]|uniref:anthrone oxygenase family protein n=1 Tax=Taibaiella koreensis TaxID=1268548 RepID=UPI000E59DDDC|nr:anthrone oxygenase family protein [Taibaiella koreensis]
MLSFSRLLLLLAALTTALMAGLFYSWSVSVTPGIGRLQDAAYLKAFQEMNRAILNPVFLSCFMGTALLLPAATILHYKEVMRPRFWLLAGATLCYLIGVMGVTMMGNVPMNNSLDVFPVETASLEALAQKRASFEGPWNRLNTIRTVCATLSVLLVVLACMGQEER